MAKAVSGMMGIAKINANINKAIAEAKRASMAGLIRGANIVQNAMDKESPTVPVDVRNLQHSFFTTTPLGNVGGGGGFKGDDASKLASQHSAIQAQQKTIVSASYNPMLSMGFSANYAAFVHEMPDGTTWKKSGSGAKFFEKALEGNKAKILQAIRGEVL